MEQGPTMTRRRSSDSGEERMVLIVERALEIETIVWPSLNAYVSFSMIK